MAFSSPSRFRIARIPKGRGRYREVCIVAKHDRHEFRLLLPTLQEIYKRCDRTGAAYAFVKHRNCSLMALQHVGRQHTLSMDLENFFECVTPRHVAGVLASDLIHKCFIDGRLRQGLPTSARARSPSRRWIVRAMHRAWLRTPSLCSHTMPQLATRFPATPTSSEAIRRPAATERHSKRSGHRSRRRLRGQAGLAFTPRHCPEETLSFALGFHKAQR
jgi:hypothetical protein